MKEVDRGIGDNPEKKIYGISPDIDGDLLGDDFVAPEKGGGISRRQFVIKISATSGLIFLAGGCVSTTETPVVRTPEEAGVTPSPTLKIETPTPSPRPTPEVVPSPTVTVEAVGFGMEELTEAEQEMAAELEQSYREATQKSGFEAGTIILTHGDEEGEVGGYFEDQERGFWLLVAREEEQVLEPVLPYQETAPTWNPSEMRFEATDAEGGLVAWNLETASWEEAALPPTPTPTPEEPTPTKEPAPTPEPEGPQEYVIVQQTTGYSSPGGDEIGHIIPGKRFTILEEQDGWLYIRLEAGGEGWIQASKTAYKLASELPPSCEIPHFPDRTSDRKTGIVIKYGNPRQEIFSEGAPISPYYYWIRFQAFNIWVTKRDGRIIEIDRESQIITFDLGGGLIVQKRFTENTQVVMKVHNTYRGIPSNVAQQAGGNLCDLEERDAASILHPSEAEGANPSPEGDLWGVYIVQ